MRVRQTPGIFLLIGSLALAAVIMAAEDKPAIDPVAKEQLEKVQQLVGQWRGVGQPRRGSTADSWVEEADWAWSFDKGTSDKPAFDKGVALIGKQPKGKYFTAIKLVGGDKADQYELRATPADGGAEQRYSGSLDDAGKLTFTAAEPRDGLPDRISLRFVAEGNRLLMLLERKSTAEQYVRLAEVGYTRQGSGFGQGKTGPECVVTGGLGTIEVTHNGQKYYVCCTGCLEYFKDNPDEIIAEYKARKEEEKAKKEQGR